ncbi:MAG TPA: hypothetical protein VIG57_10045, partial [Candidatus Entotheonella sp.]
MTPSSAGIKPRGGIHAPIPLGAEPEQCFFWATHAGAELDLLVVQGSRRLGFEFKRTSTPRRRKSMQVAMADLGLERLDVIYPG